jgi:hypothetical protein
MISVAGKRICRRRNPALLDFGYQDSGDVTGTFETNEPFLIRVDLDGLG